MEPAGEINSTNDKINFETQLNSTVVVNPLRLCTKHNNYFITYLDKHINSVW